MSIKIGSNVVITSGRAASFTTVTATTLDTGQGANELYDMNQNVKTDSAVTFTTVDTGQGANELYDMNQNVKTDSNVEFGSVTAGGYGEIWGSVKIYPNGAQCHVTASSTNYTSTGDFTSIPHPIIGHSAPSVSFHLNLGSNTRLATAGEYYLWSNISGGEPGSADSHQDNNWALYPFTLVRLQGSDLHTDKLALSMVIGPKSSDWATGFVTASVLIKAKFN